MHQNSMQEPWIFVVEEAAGEKQGAGVKGEIIIGCAAMTFDLTSLHRESSLRTTRTKVNFLEWN